MLEGAQPGSDRNQDLKPGLAPKSVFFPCCCVHWVRRGNESSCPQTGPGERGTGKEWGVQKGRVGRYPMSSDLESLGDSSGFVILHLCKVG